MKKRKIFTFCRAISLRDKCLVIFMMAFMLQTASTLFYGKCVGLYASNIDVVVRTTMAAIFGYFISSNFMSKEIINKKKDKGSKVKDNCTCQIEEKLELTPETPTSQNENNRIQIIIVTFIGLFSLFILFFARDTINAPQDALATISQLRSFVSGCVGFLIGMPPEKKER